MLNKLQDYIDRVLLHNKRSNFQDSLFHASASDLSISLLGFLGPAGAGAFILLLPFFLLIIKTPSLREASLAVCINVGVFGVLAALGIILSDYLRYYVRWFMTILVVLGGSTSGMILGYYAHGMESPFLHTLFIFPIFTIPFLLSVFRRVAFSFTLMAGSLMGYYLTANIGNVQKFIEFSILTTLPVILCMLAGHALYHFQRENFFRNRKIKIQRQRNRLMAIRDQLTGLYNHDTFTDKLDKEISRAQHSNTNVSAMVIDLDHFKKVNDTYGHGVGDDVLQVVGDIISGEKGNTVRDTDITARYGGEEFCIAMPETETKGAKKVGRRILKSMRNTEFTARDETFTVTASVGVADLKDGALHPEALLKLADQAMYYAKEHGRNQVIAWQDLSLKQRAETKEASAPPEE